MVDSPEKPSDKLNDNSQDKPQDNPRKNALSKSERRAIFSLSGIFSLRMFGLFMLLPILAVYAKDLSQSTPTLMGLALGAYGLTQAIFQIPFGLMADRINRKYVIAFGLVIFVIGSIIAGLSESIYGLIFGRCIQGAGAVSSAILALSADLTRSSQRTKAMAMIGITIGFSFMLALIVAPPLQQYIGVSGLFWMVAILGLIAIFVLFKLVPEAQSNRHHDAVGPALEQIGESLRNFQLMQLNIGIFISHLVLTALFVVLPVILIEQGNYPLSSHWKIYIPILLLSVIGMTPFVMAATKIKWIAVAYRCAIAVLLIAFFGMFLSKDHPVIWLLFAVTIFFSVFNALESMLPSLVSQISAKNNKGTSIAIYNTFQFTGVFIGGVCGGWIYGNSGPAGVFLFCGVLVALWLILSCIYSKFSLTATKVFEIGELNRSQRDDLIARIETLKGIEEVTIVDGETVVHLEVNERVYDHAEVQRLIKT